MAHESDDSDHYDLDESSDEDENGFFDLEASEASSDAEADEDLGPVDAATATIDTTFHKFALLPPELQEMVWKAFCPDLTTTPRVFSISFYDGLVVLGPGVESQIDPMRKLLAVVKRTRALALKYSPHRLELPHGGGVVPCHLERDIISLEWDLPELATASFGLPGSISVLAGFADGLQNLAFQIPTGRYDVASIDGLLHFPYLRNIFVLHYADQIPTKGLAWCVVADKTHEYHMKAEEADDGAGNPGPEIHSVFCWPDPEKYGDAGEQDFNERRLGAMRFDEDGNVLGPDDEILEEQNEHPAANYAWNITKFREALHNKSLEKHWPVLRAGNAETSDGDDEDEGTAGCRKIQVWPMALFETEQDIQRLHDMKAWRESWEDWQSDGDRRSFAEPNEYESDGIDDDPVDDFLTTDDEDDFPPPFLDVSSEHSSDVEDFREPQFSIDSKPEYQDDGSSNASDPDDQRASRNRHTARRVVDSGDSDDESATEAGSPPRTTSRRRARAVLDDSDDEEEDEGDKEDDAPQPARGRRRRTRPIPVDSEDDEEEEEMADQDQKAPAPRPGKRKARAVESSESDSGSGDSSDSDEPPPKRMSLAKRLQMEHQQAQASLPTADSDSSDADGYGGVSDDEEDVDPSVQDGTVMDVMEGGGEDEGDDEEGFW